ncbi:MAG TPA: hypothetical protein VFB73_05300 [Chloroflexota bacterium]|nr:hypothetical protein [Chloroflexota bacterium]
MLTVTNEALVRRQVRKGNLFLVASMLVFAAGFTVTCLAPQHEPNPLVSTFSLAALLLGIFLWQVSYYFIRRWGPRYRQDAALARTLRGLDNRYVFVSFADPRLPDYLLLGPHGVRVLVPRAVTGTVRCQNDRWARAETPRWLAFLFGDPVRNPTAEATQGISQVQRYLEQRLGADEARQVPVSATIVFLDPKVRLEINGCAFPVTRLRDLRAHILRDKGPLSPAQQTQLRQLFSPPGASAAAGSAARGARR